MAALAPLAGLKMSAATSTVAGGGAATASALAALSAKLKIAAASLLILGAAFILWQLLSGPPDIPPRDSLADVPSRSSAKPVRESTEQSALDSRVALAPADTRTRPPPPLDVTWKGSLIDYTGIPLGGVNIRLEPPGRVSGLPEIMKELGETGEEDANPVYESTCSAEGGFEFSDLPPGRYKVSLLFPRVPFQGTHFRPPELDHYERWGEITFEEPGIKEKDLNILCGENAVVRGEVIDESTGLPVKREGISITLVNYPLQNVYLTKGVSPKDGTFCFRCIPEGEYQLILAGPGGYNKFYIMVMKVRRGELKDDIRLAVPVLGKLHMRLAGFSFKEAKELKICLVPAESLASKLDEGAAETSMDLEEGPLRITVASEELGTCTRTVDILPGKTTELAIQRADLTREEAAPVTVLGRLVMPDGTPGADAWIDIVSAPEGKGVDFQPAGITDEDGCFTLEDIIPGLWTLSFGFFHPDDLERARRTGDAGCKVKYCKIAFFNAVPIPDCPSGQYQLDLKIPKGRLSAALYDGFTNAPLDKSVGDFKWTASVKESRRYITLVSVFVSSDFTNRLDLIGIPAGDFVLEIQTPNYTLFQKPFTLKEGERLDLGDIRLKPGGMMDLQVVDAKGSAVSSYIVTCRDRLLGLGEHLAAPINPTTLDPIPTTRYSSLPVGPVKFRIKAEGHLDREVTLNLQPGMPQDVRVVLEKK